MLILDQTHPTTRSAALNAPFHTQPFLPESRRRIRPLHHPFVPPTHPAFLSHVTTTSTSSTALYSYSPSLQHLAAATAAVTPHTVSFLRLAIVFVAGGLFFSSAMATATACYAIGKDNIHRFREMTKIVWESVWQSFAMGLAATKEVLVGDVLYSDDYWNEYTHENDDNKKVPLWRRYQEAWRVLKCKLAETRRKAVEGVQAIQREVKLCAAAVGPPGLIPLQYILDRQLHFTIAGGIQEALQASLNEVELSNVDLKLSHFDAGPVAPKLESARVYDLGDNAMAFDYDVTWDSAMEATIQVQSSYLPSKVPVTLHNVHFRGPVRVVMTPLTKEYPGFGATLVSFPSMPEIGMDVRVAGGEVTKVVPRIRAEILASIEQTIAESMIWPKRAVVPSYPMHDPHTPILSTQELEKLETTDPLLEAEEALGTRPVLRRKLNQMSELLYCDQCNDEELLKSILDLPMPSFKSDKRETKERQTTTKPQVATTAPTATAMEHGRVWDQLQDIHQMVVDRHNVDVATTHRLIKKTAWWKDMEKIHQQTKEKLKELHFTSL